MLLRLPAHASWKDERNREAQVHPFYDPGLLQVISTAYVSAPAAAVLHLAGHSSPVRGLISMCVLCRTYRHDSDLGCAIVSLDHAHMLEILHHLEHVFAVGIPSMSVETCPVSLEGCEDGHRSGAVQRPCLRYRRTTAAGNAGHLLSRVLDLVRAREFVVP